MRSITILVILFIFIITPFSYAEANEEIIKRNEKTAINFVMMTLYQRVAYHLSHKTYPKKLSDFMNGFDMGELGTIKVNELGKIDFLGYIYTYYSSEDSFRLTAEPALPGVTGRRYFAVGKKPDGDTTCLVEDINKNGFVDVDEPQLIP